MQVPALIYINKKLELRHSGAFMNCIKNALSDQTADEFARVPN